MPYPRFTSKAIRFDEDWHVHSTFSDGAATIEQNIHAAEARDLRRLCLVDHVRRSTTWVAEFAAACREARRETPVAVSCGVEAKLLNTQGELDLPPGAEELADLVLAADHQLPTPRGPVHPDVGRELIESGELPASTAVQWIVCASANAVLRYDRVVLAHPFSILPKLGLDDGDVSVAMVVWLATVMSSRGAATEVSERWRCPAPWMVPAFLDAGVDVHASTDSHALETLGEYEWCREAAAGIDPPRLVLPLAVAA